MIIKKIKAQDSFLVNAAFGMMISEEVPLFDHLHQVSLSFPSLYVTTFVFGFFFLFLLVSLSSIPAQILRYNKTCFLKFFVGPIGSYFRITRTRFCCCCWCHCSVVIFLSYPKSSNKILIILQGNGFRALTNVTLSIVVKTFHIF